MQNNEDKRQFALKLALDKEGAWLKIKEKSECSSSHIKGIESGWLHIWEVAALEGNIAVLVRIQRVHIR